MRSRYVTALIAAIGLLALPAGLPAKAVVNGDAAEDGDFPFMAAVQYAEDGYTICGGSVISADWVLTAAHCVDDVEDDLQVVTGRTDLGDEESGQVIAVTEVIVHKRFNTGSMANDVALLRLAESTTAVPIQLAAFEVDDDLEEEGTPVWVAGWGDTLPTYGLSGTDELQFAELEVQPDADCARAAFPFKFSEETSVCAGAFMSDACAGDSGGPLWASKDDTIIQIGIVSDGNACGVPTMPGAYTEVNSESVREFIEENAGV